MSATLVLVVVASAVMATIGTRVGARLGKRAAVRDHLLKVSRDLAADWTALPADVRSSLLARHFRFACDVDWLAEVYKREAKQ